jgi:hypothetical protein
MNITKSAKMTRVLNATASGTSTVNGSVIDMQGYQSVTFVCCMGGIASSAVTTMKVQSNTSSATGTMGDLAGSAISIADTDDNKVVAIEIVNPRERYLRPVITRSTANAGIDSVIALQTQAAAEPVTHDSSTVSGTELHQAVATGTA